MCYSNKDDKDTPEKKKKESYYITIGAYLVAKHNIPVALQIDADETNAYLLTSVKRAPTRQKRVKVIEVGKEKSQLLQNCGQ